MQLEPRDVIQLALILVSAGATIAVLKAESKHQASQHEDLKSTTKAQFENLTRQITNVTTTVSAVTGDSREHGARIGSLEGRVDRAEGHIDQIGRDLGLGRRA